MEKDNLVESMPEKLFDQLKAASKFDVDKANDLVSKSLRGEKPAPSAMEKPVAKSPANKSPAKIEPVKDEPTFQGEKQPVEKQPVEKQPVEKQQKQKSLPEIIEEFDRQYRDEVIQKSVFGVFHEIGNRMAKRMRFPYILPIPADMTDPEIYYTLALVRDSVKQIVGGDRFSFEIVEIAPEVNDVHRGRLPRVIGFEVQYKPEIKIDEQRRMRKKLQID